nr:hypothetical protein [Collimonas humicola]
MPATEAALSAKLSTVAYALFAALKPVLSNAAAISACEHCLPLRLTLAFFLQPLTSSDTAIQAAKVWLQIVLKTVFIHRSFAFTKEKLC